MLLFFFVLLFETWICIQFQFILLLFALLLFYSFIFMQRSSSTWCCCCCFFFSFAISAEPFWLEYSPCDKTPSSKSACHIPAAWVLVCTIADKLTNQSTNSLPRAHFLINFPETFCTQRKKTSGLILEFIEWEKKQIEYIEGFSRFFFNLIETN